MANPLKDRGWSKKSKGCAKIYTHPNSDHAIVDRRGFGINSATGLCITYKGVGYKTLEEAAVAAAYEDAAKLVETFGIPRDEFDAHNGNPRPSLSQAIRARIATDQEGDG